MSIKAVVWPSIGACSPSLPHCSSTVGRATPCALLHEAFDEGEGGVADLAPSAVDGQRVAAVGHLDDLGDAGVVLLLLVGGVGDRPGHGVVLLPGDDQ